MTARLDAGAPALRDRRGTTIEMAVAAQADPSQATRSDAATPRPVTARGVEGLVLCGGASRRLGTDKASLVEGGRTLLERAVALLAPFVDECRLACGPTERYAELGRPLVLDAFGGAGPLAGLVAGLESARAERVFALACDMPALDPPLVGALLAQSEREGLDVCLALGPRGPEPLCGVYRTTCAAPARAALEAGERRVVSFWGRPVRTPGGERALRIGGLDVAALAAAGSRADVTLNVNTAADWARAAERMEGGGGR